MTVTSRLMAAVLLLFPTLSLLTTETVTLSGTIHSTSDKPIANAEVQLLSDAAISDTPAATGQVSTCLPGP